MPPIPHKKICKVCGCVTTNADGYCDEHKKQKEERLYDKRRGSPSKRGYDYRWTQFSKAYLRKHPLCVQCEKDGYITPATEIHHIKMLRDGGSKYDESNLMALCHSCHSRITMQETINGGQTV